MEREGGGEREKAPKGRELCKREELRVRGFFISFGSPAFFSHKRFALE